MMWRVGVGVGGVAPSTRRTKGSQARLVSPGAVVRVNPPLPPYTAKGCSVLINRCLTGTRRRGPGASTYLIHPKTSSRSDVQDVERKNGAYANRRVADRSLNNFVLAILWLNIQEHNFLLPLSSFISPTSSSLLHHSSLFSDPLVNFFESSDLEITAERNAKLEFILGSRSRYMMTWTFGVVNFWLCELLVMSLNTWGWKSFVYLNFELVTRRGWKCVTNE